MTPLHFAQEYVATIKVANLETGAEISVPVRDKGSDQFAARFKKVAKDRRKNPETPHRKPTSWRVATTLSVYGPSPKPTHPRKPPSRKLK